MVSQGRHAELSYRYRLNVDPLSAARRGRQHAVIPERIRVLAFHENSTPLGLGRVALGFADQARHAEPDLPAIDVTFVTYRRANQQTAFAEAAVAARIPVIEIPERKRWDLGVLKEVRRIVTDFKPDILETHNMKSHFLVRANGLQRHFPWVAWNHGYTSRDRIDRAYKQADRWCLRGAFRLMTVCQPFAAAMQELGIPRNKITVLHNFVDTYTRSSDDDVLRLKQQLGLNDELVIVTIGRMSLEKGHTDLLDAIALLKETPGLPRHGFVLVGDGPEEQNLRRKAASLGIEDRILWAGFQKNVAPYYAAASIFALPSHSEGSPNVILEAMSAGLPIAATRAGGVPEILEDNVTGLMVPTRDPQALAGALQKLLLSEDLRARLASAARRQVETAHTLQAYKRALTKFYVETLKMRDPASDLSS
jgi:glycosyltransferase involved in cell wall biosynthesis